MTLARKKLKQTLEVIIKPISRARFFETRPIVVLKSMLFQIPHVVYMQLDGFENLEDLPVFRDYYIRTYRKGDEYTWTRIVNRSFLRLFPGDIDEICESNNFDPDGFFFLIYNNQAVGTVYAKQEQDGNLKVGWITALCVVPEHQGKKLGRFLLLQALHHFKSKGLRSVFLDVDEFNEAAIKTYLSAGFKHAAKLSSLQSLYIAGNSD